jgi:hypothetical protein
LEPKKDTKGYHLFASKNKDGTYSFTKYRSLPKYVITGKSKPVDVPLNIEMRIDSLSNDSEYLHRLFKTKEEVKAFTHELTNLRGRINAERQYGTYKPEDKLFLFTDKNSDRTPI